MRALTSLAFTIIVGLVVSVDVHAIATYSFTDLGVVSVSGLNDMGQVIGSRYDVTTKSERGFLYDASGMNDLGPNVRPVSINNKGQMTGVIPSNSGWGAAAYFSSGAGAEWVSLGGLSGYGKTSASTINDSGTIIGFSYNTRSYIAHGFVSNGVTLTAFGGSSMPKDINSSGVVTGDFTNQSGKMRAFILENNIMHDLGTLGGYYSAAQDVNELGQVAGLGYNAAGFSHAVTSRGYDLIDLGTLGGNSSEALAINNKGQVVGWSDTTGGYRKSHAFTYDSSGMHDLGTLGGDLSSATDINDSGDIIGWSTSTKYGTRDAFLYSHGEMINIESLAAGFDNINTSSLFLNELGQVAGVGMSNGQWRGFLITPLHMVSEPKSCLLLLTGLFILVTTTKHRRLQAVGNKSALIYSCMH